MAYPTDNPMDGRGAVVTATDLLKLAKKGLASLEGEWLRILNNRPNLTDQGYRRLRAEPVVVALLADIEEGRALIARAEGR